MALSLPAGAPPDDGAIAVSDEDIFEPKVRRWLIPTAALGAVITLGWGMLAEPPVETTAGANGYSRSAVGYEALAETLDDAGLRVLVSRWRSARRAGPGAPVLALEPLPEHLDELEELAQTAARRDAVVVLGLPKWRYTEDHRGWVSAVSLVEADEALEPLEQTANAPLLPADLVRPAQATGWRGLPEGVAPELPYYPQLLSWSALPMDPIISADQGVLVARLRTSPEVVVVSDPDLWNTHGLSRPANAAVAGWLVDEGLGAEAVVLDEVIHGYERAPSIWRELLTWPLSLFTLQLAGLALLTLAASGGRMGPPRTPPPRLAPGVEGLVENTARLLEHGGYAGLAARRYFLMTVRDLAARHALPPGLDTQAQLERLDALERSSRKSAAIWRALGRLPKGRGGARRALALAQATWTWKQEMLNVK
jgi:hypothetical protein